MTKIFSSEEIRPEKLFLSHSDSYAVRFWLKEGEIVKQKKVIYYACGKNKHKAVEKRVLRDYKIPKDKIISICFE